MASTTWDPLNTCPGAVLSGGNLIVTHSSTDDGYEKGRSTDSYSSGKYYFEMTFNSVATTNTLDNDGFGIANSTQSTSAAGFTTADVLGGTTQSVGWYPEGTGTAAIYKNAVQTTISAWGTIAQNDVIGCAVDFDNKRIWFKKIAAGGVWNDGAASPANDPSINLGGYDFSSVTGPYYAAWVVENLGASWKANFGDSAFAGPVPTGFLAWSPTAPFYPATWNPFDMTTGAAGFTASGGNLTVTRGGTASQACVRSTNSWTSGKKYFEISVGHPVFDGDPEIGLANSTHTISSGNIKLGDVTSIGLTSNTAGTRGEIQTNSVTTTFTGLQYANNSRVGVAVDVTNKIIWYRVNGGNWMGTVGSANPASNTGGQTYAFTGAVFAAISENDTAIAFTANFGDTTFTDAMPAGFSAWSPSALGDLQVSQAYLSIPIITPQQWENRWKRAYLRL